ncbi:membrane protein implicated in regulation of membrane protease activity [Alkalibacillus filiformis]|uniref:Membrane protein implicated in regulation of membrane protease activity n=1 Tax=Alkalibacillus filiformis TaxID=200990 RepID=A0ABU0DRM6_9BACI|nr:sporulation protein YpjB [Alkalibacillus filiformis]MDQ0350845.1 membrane protein implicated in regulation of membrane protease activity [Alkalibacillus filiformis]
MGLSVLIILFIPLYALAIVVDMSEIIFTITLVTSIIMATLFYVGWKKYKEDKVQSKEIDD